MATPNPIGTHNVSSYLNLRHTSGQYDTAIMFVGAAGVGKSTLCNFLSRKDVFETFDTPISLTKKANSHSFPAWNYTFIIFTHEEDMMSQTCSTKEYILAYLKNPDCSKLLLQTFRNVKCSYICIESVKCTSDNEYWEIKCKELFDHIETIKNETGHVRFDSILMSRGKELYARCLKVDAENEKLVKRNDGLRKELKKSQDSQNELVQGIENYEKGMRNIMQQAAFEE